MFFSAEESGYRHSAGKKLQAPGYWLLADGNNRQPKSTTRSFDGTNRLSAIGFRHRLRQESFEASSLVAPKLTARTNPKPGVRSGRHAGKRFIGFDALL